MILFAGSAEIITLRIVRDSPETCVLQKTHDKVTDGYFKILKIHVYLSISSVALEHPHIRRFIFIVTSTFFEEKFPQI